MSATTAGCTTLSAEKGKGKGTRKRYRCGQGILEAESGLSRLSVQPSEAYFSSLRNLWDERILTDVTLRVLDPAAGELDIPAHRVVLAAGSRFFRALFAGPLCTTEQVIFLPDVDWMSLHTIVKSFYHSYIEADDDDIERLIRVSDRLEVLSVKECLCEALHRLLSPATALHVLAVADTYACASLSADAVACAVAHFSSACKHDAGFASWCRLDQRRIMSLLSSDDLEVASEESAFEAARAWIAASPPRSSVAADVLSCVRLPLVSAAVLATAQSDRLFISAPRCVQLIEDAMAAQLSRALQEAVDSSKAALGGCVPSRRMTRSAAAREKEALRAGASTFWASVKPRLRTPRGLVSVGGWDSGVTVVAVAELYDPLKDEWSPVPGPTLPRSCASVSALDGCLFVCGGCSDPGGRVSEASVEIWDPRRGTWTPGPPLSVRRSRLGAAALGRGLFVVGGFDGQRATYHSSCEVFEKRRGAWRRCADMIAARATMGVAALNGFLYAVGGCDGTGAHLATAERYDPNEDVWRPIAPMKCRRSGVAVGVMQGYLYACGGSGSQVAVHNSVERYDPATDQWEEVAPMTMRRSGAGVAVLGGDRLYAAGGVNGYTWLNSAEVYNPRTNAWTPVTPMSESRSGVSVGTFDVAAE